MGWLAGPSLLWLTLPGFTEGKQGGEDEDAQAVEEDVKVGKGWRTWRRGMTTT